MTDVAGMQPAILDGALGLGVVLPIAVHDQLAADEDFTIVGDARFHTAHGRPNRVHRNARRGAVATDDGAGFGLPVPLQHGQPHCFEEDADFGVERSAARHHGLDPSAEALADLGPQQAADRHVLEPVPELGIVRHAALGNFERGVHQLFGDAALLLDLFHDPGPQDLEQARDDNHDRGAGFLDIAGELLEPFGVIDLRAHTDRQELPAAVFIGMTEREEGQEPFVPVDTEIIDQDFAGTGHVAQDRAVVLAHAARGAAGAAGIDDAGCIAAPDRRDAVLDRCTRSRRIALEHGRPVVIAETARLLAMEIVDPDNMFGHPRRLQRAMQRAQQFLGRNDHRARPRIVEDMHVIALGIGDVGRHGNAARGHDRQVGNAPFGPVFRHQAYAVAILQPEAAQIFGEQAHLLGRFAPADGLPPALALCAEKRLVALFIRTFEEKFDEIVRGIYFRQHGRLLNGCVLHDAVLGTA